VYSPQTLDNLVTSSLLNIYKGTNDTLDFNKLATFSGVVWLELGDCRYINNGKEGCRILRFSS
jgi:hypothetical protein